MKKAIPFLILCIMSIPLIALASTSFSPETKKAVSLYNSGNYSGAYQILDKKVTANKNANVYEMYYYALSAWKLNKIKVAQEYMKKVIEKNPPEPINKYAHNSEKCLSNYTACMEGKLDFSDKTSDVDSSDELDRFILNGSFGFSREIDKEVEQKQLNVLKNEINSDKDLDGYTFQKYKDYTKK